MANSDSSLIDNLIQELQNTFDKIKSGKTSKFQAELSEVNQETNDLKNQVPTKLDELLAQSADNDEIAELKKEFDDLTAKITNTLSDLSRKAKLNIR